MSKLSKVSKLVVSVAVVVLHIAVATRMVPYIIEEIKYVGKLAKED